LKVKIVLSLTGVALFAASGTATTISGNVYTEFYSYESKIPASNSHLRSLQGYRLNISDAFISGLSAFASGRLASDISDKSPTDPDYRVFGAYLQYRSRSDRFLIRAGRQFVYEGLGGLTLDGGKLKIAVGKNISLSGFGGTVPGPSFFTYDQVNRWNRRNAFGGRVSVKASGKLGLNFSFLQKEVDENLDARLIGLDAAYRKGRCSNSLRVDYDLYAKKVKLVSLRPQFRYKGGHDIRLEYSYRKPLLGYNSVFSVIDAKSIHQARLNAVYRNSTDLRTIAAVAYTMFSDDSNINIRAGVIFKGQSGGLAASSGYGGTKVGFFGGLRHDLNDDLTVYGNLDMYNLKLDSDEDEQEMFITAVFGGAYDVMKNLGARAEIQILSNPVYDYDTRGYVRLDYDIQYTGNGGGDAK